VVFSPAPRDVREVKLSLAPGSTVRQALQAAGMLESVAQQGPSLTTIGVWGRKVALQQTLLQNDRVEIYRELKVDPKVARRARFAKQGVRGAGLFVKKRLGASAGQ
jgi:putative ubiquitin-RnfH superfamily antitoxin RatB of RatAB toxin-antitoxin module